MSDRLFNIKEESLGAKLENKLEQGIFFYSINESKHLLNLTDAQVRYAIEHYRIDAVLIFNEYRIPYTALLRYQEGEFERLDREYFTLAHAAEFPGIYALNTQGDLTLVKKTIRDKGLEYHVIPDLFIDKEPVPYDSLPSKEENKEDLYDLQNIDFPYSAAAYEWANILKTRTQWIMNDFDVKADDLIDWPTMYDWLIEREVANLEIPYATEVYSGFINSSELSKQVQLSLFENTI